MAMTEDEYRSICANHARWRITRCPATLAEDTIHYFMFGAPGWWFGRGYNRYKEKPHAVGTERREAA